MEVEFNYTWYGKNEPFTAAFMLLPFVIYMKQRGTKGLTFGWLFWAVVFELG